MYILGISALYHDSAATLIKDGEILAAAQEERFTRVKHDSSLPLHAIEYCLREAGISVYEINAICYYDMPILTLDRWLKNILAAGEDSVELIRRGFKLMFRDRIWVHNRIIEKLRIEDNNIKVYMCEHHISHAASAFYPSPFEKAVIITLDGVGEWATTTISVGNCTDIEIKEEIQYPHSLGLFYSAFTYFCGFKVNSGDYKFMGLAPYGEPVYEQVIRDEIIDIKQDGSFRLNLEYFDFQYGRAMINDKFAKLFGGDRRYPESIITKREMDIAASVQKVVEDIVVRMVRHAKQLYGTEIDNLVMAGGVALNCVANGKIQREKIFSRIWIQPAAGDAGGSLGCALYSYYRLSGMKRKVQLNDSMKGSYLGPRFTVDYIKNFLDTQGYCYHEYNEPEIYDKIAEELSKEKIIGLFQGRMEFGPRALGARSIIADARTEEIQTKLNLKIKYRESFRPFAPSVLKESVMDYFDVGADFESPYMLLVDSVREEKCVKIDTVKELEKANWNMLSVVKQKRSDIPAVTHVDYSARIQTVTEERNPYYFKVLNSFKKLTGCSVIVNTSFNVRGEPIVCTPQDAYTCFMRTDMDVLVIENLILYKNEQPVWIEENDWREEFILD